MCLNIQDFSKHYYLTSTLFLPLWSSCDCQLRPSSGDFVWWLCRLLLVSTMPELGSPSWTLSGCGWIWPHLHSYTGTWSLTQAVCLRTDLDSRVVFHQFTKWRHCYSVMELLISVRRAPAHKPDFHTFSVVLSCQIVILFLLTILAD